jgi:hypothetical protein
MKALVTSKRSARACGPRTLADGLWGLFGPMRVDARAESCK